MTIFLSSMFPMTALQASINPTSKAVFGLWHLRVAHQSRYIWETR